MYGSNPSDVDDLVEYLHEVDVCAEEDFWWDEEDRHELWPDAAESTVPFLG